MSRLALGLLTALLLLLATSPAQALPVLADADGADLAETLQTATEAQGVCYGWNVGVSDQGGGPSGEDVGSDKGAGAPVDRACAKWVELQGRVLFTCESCESEDSAGLAIDANFDGAPTVAELAELGFTADRLLRDDSDVGLTNMVGALPLITASNGAAPPVPAPAAADAPTQAAGDVPTGTPSTPDWLREHWLALAFFLVLVLGGAGWLVQLARDDRVSRRMRPSPLTPRKQ